MMYKDLFKLFPESIYVMCTHLPISLFVAADNDGE